MTERMGIMHNKSMILVRNNTPHKDNRYRFRVTSQNKYACKEQSGLKLKNFDTVPHRPCQFRIADDFSISHNQGIGLLKGK